MSDSKLIILKLQKADGHFTLLEELLGFVCWQQVKLRLT